MYVKIMVAMCSGNRGVGYRGALPWPHIEEDFNYYRAQIRKKQDPSKKNLLIEGRLTWESGAKFREYDPSITYVVISSTMKSEDDPVFKPTVARSVEESLRIATEAVKRGEVENVWVMGGERVWEEVIKSPLCKQIYLTQVYRDFPSDAFMPPFEDLFKKSSDPAVDGNLKTDKSNGIQYRFEVYERIRNKPI